MAGRSLTRVQGGVTDTVYINTDRFAGVRTMTVSVDALPLTDSTTSIQVIVAGHANISGIYTGSTVAGATWSQQGGNGTITASSFDATDGYQYLLEDGDGDPQTLLNNGAGFTDRPWKAVIPSGITITGIAGTETVTVDRTASVIDSDRKGASRPLLSKVVGGAAAAYSLRDLNDKAGNNKVVRVRRASDNHERDFLAKEVSNGTLKNWVNTQTVLPLDIQALVDSDSDGHTDGRTGAVIPAKAAYSLRNLSKNYTGNVVDVRRFTDGATNSYTADEITGGTLTAFANESVKYFDSTGTSTQTVTTNGFGFTVSAGAPFNADYSFSATGGFNNTEKYSFTGHGSSGSFAKNFYFGNSFNVTRIGASAPAKTVTIEAYVKRTSGSSSDNLYFRPYATNTANKFTVTGLVQDEWTFVKGTLIKDSAVNARNNIQVGGDTGVTFEVSNIKFYSEDNDVTVSKWYDQSGNTNHAVQGTPASQPKIVNAGVLVDKGIDFDGVSLQHLEPSLLLPTIQNSSVFCVSTKRNNSTGYVAQLNRSADRLYIRHNFVTIGNPFHNFSGGTTNDVKTLQTVTGTSGGLFTYLKDGISVGTTNYTGDVSGGDSTIGSGANGSAEFDGVVSEIIVYETDQTDNRTAIEANIGEAYSITGIPAYDNTVDGFVEAWYDQSGNSRDATQATAGNQPKIVESGQVKDHLLFDGTNYYLALTTPLDFDDGSGFFTVKGASSDGSQTLMGGHSGSNYLPLLQNNNTGNHYTNSMTVSSEFVNGNQQTWADRDDAFDAVITDNYVLASFIDINTTSNALLKDIGRGAGATTWVFKGEMKEVILYTSDQSANRPAIEANINNQYDIY